MLGRYPAADLYAEWSTNEKVALDVAIGAALSGVRAIACMKHVGLNVAADSLMSQSYIGAHGGLVLVVCDDPGIHSSQNEQDTRLFARFAGVPVLEPSDAQEALDFTRLAFELSEDVRHAGDRALDHAPVAHPLGRARRRARRAALQGLRRRARQDRHHSRQRAQASPQADRARGEARRLSSRPRR